MKHKRRYALTLLEIMIVISLITIIMGVLGYNMKKVLDKGKVFRTEQAIERLHNVFDLAVATGDATYQKIAADPQLYVNESELARSSKDLLKDGWGGEIVVSYNPSKGDLNITSKALADYRRRNQT